MPAPATVWPPHVGDRVGIRGNRLLGTVERIEQQDHEQRYILSLFAPPGIDAGDSYELTQAARVARTTFSLAELEPHG